MCSLALPLGEGLVGSLSSYQKKGKNMTWTQERIALLTEMWGLGKTAAQIAQILGDGVTRNAVIGKAHRLFLTPRASPLQQNSAKKKPLPEEDIPQQEQKAPPVVKNVAFGHKSLLDIGPRMCCFPLGDPKKTGFGFCGEQALSGLPYCEKHAAIAYQPTARTRLRDLEEEMGEGPGIFPAKAVGE